MNLEESLIYRDGMILVLNKPAGIAVHKGPGGGQSLEEHFSSLCFGWPHPPALAHRLDRDTSGCLVLGRHRKALAKLGRLFQAGEIEKTYLGVTRTPPAQSAGLIDAPLSKHSTKEGGWYMRVDDAGKPSRTLYQTLHIMENAQALVAFYPLTGRTHQIRVHAAHIGCPLVGEWRYAESDNAPLHLHSWRIIIPLSRNKPAMDVLAPLPEHMAHYAALLPTTPPTPPLL